AKTREDEVVALLLEGMRGGIADDEGGVVDAVRARRADKRLRDVDAQHMTGGSHGARQGHRRAASAAADIDDMLARSRRSSRQDELPDLAEGALDPLVSGEPAFAARAVPIGRLLSRELGRALRPGTHAGAAAFAAVGL